MLNKTKICAITGSRADFGLMYPSLKQLQNSEKFELTVIATGMHLSPEFGETYREIEKKGFHLSRKIEVLLSSNTKVGVGKATGLGVISFTEALSELMPDAIFVLGDRFEILSVVIAAGMLNIPIIHLHGGELTLGAIDDKIRHAISKFSNYHFVTTEIYRKRLLQLGESPSNVFNVGSFGIENVVNAKEWSIEELEKSLSIKLNKDFAVVTFHPETEQGLDVKVQLNNFFSALNEFPNLQYIFTLSNADENGRYINEQIKLFIEENSQHACFPSLGFERYLALVKKAAIIIGNSSSGILEISAINVGVVNIGMRQEGRVKAGNVVDCNCIKESIVEAIQTAMKMDYDPKDNPYGIGNSSTLLIEALEKVDLSSAKKTFIDIE